MATEAEDGPKCPNCGEPFSVSLTACLPEQTDLTISLTVEPGQFVRLDTIAGVLSAFRDLQIAVGAEMGSETDVFLAGLTMADDVISITTRIVNSPKVPA